MRPDEILPLPGSIIVSSSSGEVLGCWGSVRPSIPIIGGQYRLKFKGIPSKIFLKSRSSNPDEAKYVIPIHDLFSIWISPDYQLWGCTAQHPEDLEVMDWFITSHKGENFKKAEAIELLLKDKHVTSLLFPEQMEYMRVTAEIWKRT